MYAHSPSCCILHGFVAIVWVMSRWVCCYSMSHVSHLWHTWGVCAHSPSCCILQHDTYVNLYLPLYTYVTLYLQTYDRHIERYAHSPSCCTLQHDACLMCMSDVCVINMIQPLLLIILLIILHIHSPSCCILHGFVAIVWVMSRWICCYSMSHVSHLWHAWVMSDTILLHIATSITHSLESGTIWMNQSHIPLNIELILPIPSQHFARYTYPYYYIMTYTGAPPPTSLSDTHIWHTHET